MHIKISNLWVRFCSPRVAQLSPLKKYVMYATTPAVVSSCSLLLPTISYAHTH